MLDKYEESLEYFDKSLKMNPTNTKTLSFKSYSLMKLERNNDAESCCKKIIDLEPNNGNAHYNLAKIKIKQNKKPDALYYLRQAI